MKNISLVRNALCLQNFGSTDLFGDDQFINYLSILATFQNSFSFRGFTAVGRVAYGVTQKLDRSYLVILFLPQEGDEHINLVGRNIQTNKGVFRPLGRVIDGRLVVTESLDTTAKEEFVRLNPIISIYSCENVQSQSSECLEDIYRLRVDNTICESVFKTDLEPSFIIHSDDTGAKMIVDKMTSDIIETFSINSESAIKMIFNGVTSSLTNSIHTNFISEVKNIYEKALRTA